jgi:predicted transcriptional regulator
MKELTKAEEQVMQILWKLRKGFVKDIISELPEPKPAYNTVSTITRILEKKGFVDHKQYGNTHEYFPTITKKDYTKGFLKGFVKNYFENSYQQMVSFFAKENNLNLNDLEDIKQLIDSQIKTKKEKKS